MAASLPRSSATYSSRRLTVGSSPKTSSPTAAPAIARRIPSVGFVTVSLRRSIKTPSSFADLLLRLEHPPSRTEVNLRHLRQPLLAPFLDHQPGGPEHMRRPPRQLESHLLGERLHLLQIPGPRQDRSRRDGHVVLRPGPHLQPHPRREPRLYERAGRPRELVHDEKLDSGSKLTEYLNVDLS